MSKYKAHSEATNPFIFTDEEKCDSAVKSLNEKTSYNWFKAPAIGGFMIMCVFYGKKTFITEYKA